MAARAPSPALARLLLVGALLVLLAAEHAAAAAAGRTRGDAPAASARAALKAALRFDASAAAAAAMGMGLKQFERLTASLSPRAPAARGRAAKSVANGPRRADNGKIIPEPMVGALGGADTQRSAKRWAPVHARAQDVIEQEGQPDARGEVHPFMVPRKVSCGVV